MKTPEQIEEEITAQVERLFETNPHDPAALTALKDSVDGYMNRDGELDHVFKPLLKRVVALSGSPPFTFTGGDEEARRTRLIAEVLAACGGWRYLNCDAKGWVRSVLLADSGVHLGRDGLADLCAAKSILAGLRLPANGSFRARKTQRKAADGIGGHIKIPEEPNPDYSMEKVYRVQKVPNKQIQEGIVALPEIQSVGELKERLSSLDNSSMAELFRLMQKYPEMD